MKLSELLTPDRILIDLKEKNKTALINILLDKVAKVSNINDIDTLKSEVLEREALGNTGLGRGIGFPHAKSSQISEISVILARPAKAIEYGSLDGLPVGLILLIIAPADGDNNEYLHTMARISRLLGKKELREKLLSLKSENEIIEVISQFEA